MKPITGIRRRGFIMIIVLGLLGTLAFMTLNFIQKAQTARQLSLHGLYQTGARLAARSGLEKSLNNLMQNGWRRRTAAATPFIQQTYSAGNDIQRNGSGNTWTSLDDDLTPSYALASPGSSPATAFNLVMDGKPSGVSWMDSSTRPLSVAKIRVQRGGLDLNGGVESGEGSEGTRFKNETGTPYSASDLTHPFNERARILLNAWGNYQKYRAMVRPSMTYNTALAPDHPSNMASSNAAAPNYFMNPIGRFDRFDASREANLTTTELPLGDLLIAARPSGGYTSMSQPTAILAQYIASWVDKNGGAVTSVIANHAAEIIHEFSQLAQLQPERREEVLAFYNPADVPGLDANDATDVFNNSSFERPEGRAYLFRRFFKLKAAAVDINSAPPSLLAATLHAVRDVTYQEYWPSTNNGVDDFLRTKFLRAPKENSHFINATEPVAGNPVLSMTDCLLLANTLDQRRKTQPFSNLTSIGDAIRTWNGSYDGRKNVYDARTMTTPWFTEYMDPYMGNAREYVLAYLLNHHINSNHLVWDEAQVPAWNQRILSLGKNAAQYGFRDFSYKPIFDKFMPHKIGATFAMGHGQHDIVCKGYRLAEDGRILATSQITTRVLCHSTIDLHIQSDLIQAAIEPGTNTLTLGNEWVTYPEFPSSAPAEWDGQLALMPLRNISPYGANKLLQVPLTGYEDNPTSPDVGGTWPRGNRLLNGPSENPARGKLANSLNPAPGDGMRPLIPDTFDDGLYANDLLPGGGIRMSPYHNTLSFNLDGSGSYTNRREALLVLSNHENEVDYDFPDPEIDLSGNSKVLKTMHSGAVSFYFKPRFSCTRTSGNLSGGNQTLFAFPFVIYDPETKDRAQAMGHPINHSEIMSFYTALMRLCWGPNESSMGGRFCQTPVPWPWVPGYDHSSFAGQIASGEHLFPNMWGFDVSGENGYFLAENMTEALSGIFDTTSPWGPSGDGKPWHWSAPNPYAEERLQLEFIITKYADVPYMDYETDQQSVKNLNPTFHDWDDKDAVSKTAQTGAFTTDKALNLYDSSDKDLGGFHTLRKTFFIGHPHVIAPGPDKGQGPRDSQGNHQPLVAPGRWNHIFIAWMDLFDLLNNDGSSAESKGGALAVYINGAFNKTSPKGYSIAGLFVQQDLSELFSSGTFGPPSPWEPGKKHVIYQASGNYNPLRYPHKYYTFPYFKFATVEDPFEFIHQIPPLHYGHPNGCLIHSYDYSRISVGAFSSRNEPLYMKFPSRFYFGFTPFTQHDYDGSGNLRETPYGIGSITWGSFMDIQIFDRPDASIWDSNAGFAHELPNWTDFSVYPAGTSNPAIFYPLKLLQKQAAIPPYKIVGASWDAHLPEFHEFWDDQDAPGPDDHDSQTLKCLVNVAGITQCEFIESQDPSNTELHHWECTTPITVSSVADMNFEIFFKGQKVTMGTPIVESFELVWLSTAPRFLAYTIE
ncbi:MAG: hypothetical protein AB7F75_09375 [Planctomycetota bacterium]